MRGGEVQHGLVVLAQRDPARMRGAAAVPCPQGVAVFAQLRERDADQVADVGFGKQGIVDGIISQAPVEVEQAAG